MKYPLIIAEIGSCHGGKIELAKEAIRIVAVCGAWAVKFQLFPNTPEFTSTGNIYLPREWWPELVEYAKSLPVKIFASVWDQEGFDLLLDNGSSFVKFPFSLRRTGKNFNSHEREFTPIFSLDYLDILEFSYKNKPIKLWCIPEYPVKYKVSFDKVFERFDGFSDHTLGIRQSHNALIAGADYLEKHFKLEDSPDCPDARFAITPKELEKLLYLSRVDKQMLDKRKEMGKW